MRTRKAYPTDMNDDDGKIYQRRDDKLATVSTFLNELEAHPSERDWFEAAVQQLLSHFVA